MIDPLPPIDVKKFKRLKKQGCKRGDPLEATIEREVRLYATQKGIANQKFNSQNKAAVPDRIFFPGKGKVFFIEFKRLGAKATPAQLREHKRLRDLGFEVFVVDNTNDGVRVINTWLALNG